MQPSSFNVVLTLTNKAGIKNDILIQEGDDPLRLAQSYCLENDLPQKAVAKLAGAIESKRKEALNAHFELDKGCRSPTANDENQGHSNPFDDLPMEEWDVDHHSPRQPSSEPLELPLDEWEQSVASSSGKNSAVNLPQEAQEQEDWEINAESSNREYDSKDLDLDCQTRGKHHHHQDHQDTSLSKIFNRDIDDVKFEKYGDSLTSENYSERNIEVETAARHANIIVKALHSADKREAFCKRVETLTSPRDKIPDAASSAQFIGTTSTIDGSTAHVHMLHALHERTQKRSKRLSIHIEAEEKKKIDSTSFIKNVAFLRNSPSSKLKGVQGFSRQEREAAHTKIYERGMKRLTLKENAMDKMKAEIAAKQQEEDKNITFSPRIVTSARKQGGARRASVIGSPRSNATSSSSSLNGDRSRSSSRSRSKTPPSRGSRLKGSGSSTPVRPKMPNPDPLPSTEGEHESGEEKVSTREGEGEEAENEVTGNSDLWDWLYREAVTHSAQRLDEAREKVEEERGRNCTFKPTTSTRSNKLAEKKRAEKMSRYAKFLDSQSSTLNTNTITEEFSSSSVLGFTEEKSTCEITEEKPNAIKEAKKESRPGALTLHELAGESGAYHVGDEEEEESHSESEASESSHPHSHKKTGGDLSLDITANPFDLHEEGDHTPDTSVDHGSFPTYSPNSYVRAADISRNSQGDDEGGTRAITSNIFIDAEKSSSAFTFGKSSSPEGFKLSPESYRALPAASKADLLFESLYHGRIDSQIALKMASDKYEPKYSFQPAISPKAISCSRYSKSASGRADNSEFWKRLHETPTHSPNPYPKKEPTTEKSVEKKIDAKEIDELVKRMTEKYPLAAQRKITQQKAMIEKSMDQSMLCHQFQPHRTKDLSRLKREQSLSEIFDVLMLSAEYTRESQLTEQKPPTTKDQMKRNKSATDLFNKMANEHLEEVTTENRSTVHRVEAFLGATGSVESPIQKTAEDRDHSMTMNEHLDTTRADVADNLLDTTLTQTRFLEPKDLSDAIEIVVSASRPRALSREEFINRCELLILSGVGPPISSILIAPQRNTRSKHSSDIEADKHVRDPLIRAKKRNDKLTQSKKNAGYSDPSYDPAKYSRDAAIRKELLQRHVDAEEVKECTFQPQIHTSDSFKGYKKNAGKSYKDIIISRQSKITHAKTTVTVPFRRASIIQNTAESEHHIASVELIEKVKHQHEEEKKHLPDAHFEVEAGEEFSSQTPSPQKKFSYALGRPKPHDSMKLGTSHQTTDKSAPLLPSEFEFDTRRKSVHDLHDKEWSDSNAHSMSHVNKGGQSLVYHETTYFESVMSKINEQEEIIHQRDLLNNNKSSTTRSGVDGGEYDEHLKEVGSHDHDANIDSLEFSHNSHIEAHDDHILDLEKHQDAVANMLSQRRDNSEKEEGSENKSNPKSIRGGGKKKA